MITANRAGLALLALAALAACGGGGSDAPASVTIAGTAAKGLPLGNAAIDIKCAAATGSATAASSGAYSATISGASLPCVVRATGTEGSVFHSVVPGTATSGSFTANVTPLTEMMVAQITGAQPSAFFAGFGSASSVTSAQATQAVAYVKTAVAGITDLGSSNPATDALAVGNALDQKIDAVVAALAAQGVTLATVTTAIAANPAAPTVVSAPLAPAASDCAWLKSGKYRVINPYEDDPKWKAHVLDVDAVAKSFKDQDGVTLPFTSNGGCQYTVEAPDEPDITTKVMVSAGGVLVMHSQSKTNASQRSVAVGLPEQTLPLAELAGTWNMAGWEPVSSTPTFVTFTDELTVDASGQVTAELSCVGMAACIPFPPPHVRFSPNAAGGGFDIIEGGVAIGRVFLFKSLAGKAVFVAVIDDGMFIVGTRKEALGALPAVGTVTNFREFALNGNGTIGALLDQTVTVTATDATARTVTRLRASDNRADTLGHDKPRDGLRYRAPNSCTFNGVPGNCSEVVYLPLQGFGITLSLSVGNTNPATAFYFVSVNKPD